MDRADIPIEVALSIVLAAAVEGADRRSLLTALSGTPRPPAQPDLLATDRHADRQQAPALVFAFPTQPGAGPEHDGPAAA